MKLDKSRKYGVISGLHYASFEQDGLLFDGQGNVIANQDAAERPRLAAAMEQVSRLKVSEEEEAILRAKLDKEHPKVLWKMAKDLAEKARDSDGTKVLVYTGQGAKAKNIDTIINLTLKL